MFMTLGAVHGGAKPDRGEIPYPVGGVLEEELLGLGAALEGDHVQAVVGRGHLLLVGRLMDQVPGDLLDGEIVEGLVRVERVDHVVAVGPHTPLLVSVVSDRVGVANEIEPVLRHALAVVRRGEQGLDEFTTLECAYLRGTCRKPCQVDGKPPRECSGICAGWGGEAGSLEAREDERVNGVANPGGVRHGRYLGTRGLGPSPVPLVGGPLVNPGADRVDLGLVQAVSGVRRGHAGVRLSIGDSCEQLAGRRAARGNDLAAITQGEEPLLDVQAELGLARGRIRPVTLEAVVREDGPDVPVERYRHVPRGGRQEGQQ